MVDRWTNRISESEICFQCSICEDTGWAPRFDQNGTRSVVECDCRIRKRQISIANHAGFPIAAAKKINRYRPFDTTTQKAKTAAIRFVNEWDLLRTSPQNEESPKHNLLLLGQSRSGKTHLGRGIIRALIEREKPVQSVSVSSLDMLQELKACSNDERYDEKLSRYIDADLLFIDDFLKDYQGADELGKADRKHLFKVIDGRARNVSKSSGMLIYKPTIITSELFSEDLKELDEAIFYRLSERAIDMIVFDGKQYNYSERMSKTA